MVAARIGVGAFIIISACAAGQAAITLSGDTSSPDMSVISAGSEMQLTFSAAGMSAGQSLSLELTFVNERGQVIETRSVPVVANASGKWQGSLAAPADKLGYYRVNAQLSDGTKLSAAGSRGAGYLTYAVLPDPAQRVNYGESKSRFGLQGGFGKNWGNAAMMYLGARWGLDSGFDWKKNQPNAGDQWDGNAGTAPVQDWKTYNVPTLFMAPAWAVIPSTFKYNTGALTPEGEVAWENYVKQAAQAFAAKYPDREKNIYQITWEPIRSWGFSGTDEQLLRIYEIAYEAIHSVDPKAVVAGPTMGIQAEGGWPGHFERETQSVSLFQKGLANYIDAYTAHPYYASADAGEPEAEGMVDRLRYIRGVVEQHAATAGKTIPLYGTEQGVVDDGTPEGELKSARRLIRQNLITLGEGFSFNISFYAVDYSFNNGASVDRYGYFYNLVNGVPWGPEKVSPKPIVPAYAAQSLLLDGHDTAGAIEDMGGTRWGYCFTREEESRMVQALWDYSDAGSTYSLYTGLDQVLMYDWMGNQQWLTTNEGIVSLSLSQEPVYLITSPAWNADKNARWGESANWTTLVPNSPGAQAHFTGRISDARTISVDAPFTLGAMYFRNASSYTISGDGGLTLDTTSGNAAITVAGGSHVISTPLTLNRDLDIEVRGEADAMNLAGPIQSAGRKITKTGAGQLTMPGGTAMGVLDVRGGQVRFNSYPTHAADTAGLQIAEGAQVDLGDGHMVVRGGDLAAIRSHLASAFAARWIGPGIASQAAHDDPTFLSALGVMLNDDGAGGSVHATFLGVAGLAADDVLIRYTRYGDADLNGTIDLADYARMGTSLYWAGGDFNYDGEVNAIDYALIDFSAMRQGAPFFEAMHAQHTSTWGAPYTEVFGALEAGTYFTQGVPEPTGAACVMVAGAGTLLRRRSR